MQIALEVVELELCRLPDEIGGLREVVDAGELDDDLARLLLADLRSGHAQPVDAVPHDRDRAVEVRRGEGVALRGHGLQHDLEPTPEIETLRRVPVDRRSGHLEHQGPGQRGQDHDEQRQVFAAVTHEDSTRLPTCSPRR